MECKDCEPKDGTGEVHTSEESPVVSEALKERPVEEVTARLAQQDQEEADVLTCRLPANTTHCGPKLYILVILL